MKSNQILMAGALALSMILSGCSASSTSEDVKDDKTTETATKADSKKSTKEDSKKTTKDKKESSKTETNKNTAEAVETKETSNSENKKVEVRTQNTQQHTHNWVAQTQTIHHDAVYDEQPDWKDVDGYICDNCHQEMFTLEEAQMHVQVSAAMGSGNCKSYHAGIVRIPPGAQNPIHHDEVGHYEQVLVKDAWDETVSNGYKCSICGATK